MSRWSEKGLGLSDLGVSLVNGVSSLDYNGRAVLVDPRKPVWAGNTRQIYIIALLGLSEYIGA